MRIAVGDDKRVETQVHSDIVTIAERIREHSRSLHVPVFKPVHGSEQP